MPLFGESMDFQYKETYDISDLIHIMRILRAPDGCPWDRVQTHESIRQNFIEETYDLIHVQIVRDEKAKMSREEIEEYVSVNLNKIFKKPFKFEFEWLDAIPPDPNGKLRMIVSKVKP